LDVPAEMGGSGGPGTNPEQLFATGWAACFQSELLRLAFGKELDLSDSRVTARVGIEPVPSGGFWLVAALDLDAPQLTRDVAVELMKRAHETYPYSRGTRQRRGHAHGGRDDDRAPGRLTSGFRASLLPDGRERHLVDVAPAPVLAGLRGADDRMTTLTGVRSRVPVRRRVAAADLPAGHAHAEVNPCAPDLQALFAPFDGLR